MQKDKMRSMLRIFIGVIGAGDCSGDVYKLTEQETGRRAGKSRKESK
jgi:hypothetical protein